MTMTSPMTSLSTVMALDSRVPVDVTSDSTFFDGLCKQWGDAVTVVDLMKREASDKARFAYNAGKRIVADRARPPEPFFTPTIRQTGPMAVLYDFPKEERHWTALHDAWASDPDTAEIAPVVFLHKRPGKLKRAWFRVLDTVLDWIDAARGIE